MCDPVTAAGLALSAGGTFLQQREADKNARRVANAKNAAFTQDMNQQRVFADESAAAFNHNIDRQGKENFDEQRNAETSKFENAFNERRTQPQYNVGLSDNAPKNVVIARQKASDEASAETDRDVGNLAGLQSYGGALFNQGLDQTAFSRLFGNIQDKASGQTRLLPLRINAAANNAQKAPSLFPTLLKAGGQALSFAGASGMGDNGFTVPFTGSPSQVVNGVPIPGKKPMFIDPFGSLGSA